MASCIFDLFDEVFIDGVYPSEYASGQSDLLDGFAEIRSPLLIHSESLVKEEDIAYSKCFQEFYLLDDDIQRSQTPIDIAHRAETAIEDTSEISEHSGASLFYGERMVIFRMVEQFPSRYRSIPELCLEILLSDDQSVLMPVYDIFQYFTVRMIKIFDDVWRSEAEVDSIQLRDDGERILLEFPEDISVSDEKC